MNIQSSQSVNFKGIRVKSNMSQTQRTLAQKFIDSISYSDSYVKSLENDIDIYLLPYKNTKIKVYFADTTSDMFFLENKSNSRASLELSKNKDMFQSADNAISILDKILNFEINRPIYSYRKIINSKTDIAKIRPEHYEYMESLITEDFNLADIQNEMNKSKTNYSEF